MTNFFVINVSLAIGLKQTIASIFYCDTTQVSIIQTLKCFEYMSGNVVGVRNRSESSTSYYFCYMFISFLGSREWHSCESTRLPPIWHGFDSRTLRHMWVEFVVGSCPCSERIFSGYSGFPLSSKTNISNFQFNLDYCQAFYHEPLAQEIAQALPVLLTSNLNYYYY